jgi:ketosteroid isomerase-like protein
MPAARVDAAVLIVIVLLSLAWAPQGTPPAHAVITDLEKAWDRAYLGRDTEGLSRLLADDYVLTDASGARLTKHDYLTAVVRAPDMSRVKSWDGEKLEVRVSGQTATVTGESAVKGRPRGRGYVVEARYRFTDTWAERDGRWVAVSTTATKIDK